MPPRVSETVMAGSRAAKRFRRSLRRASRWRSDITAKKGFRLADAEKRSVKTRHSDAPHCVVKVKVAGARCGRTRRTRGVRRRRRWLTRQHEAHSRKNDEVRAHVIRLLRRAAPGASAVGASVALASPYVPSHTHPCALLIARNNVRC